MADPALDSSAARESAAGRSPAPRRAGGAARPGAGLAAIAAGLLLALGGLGLGAAYLVARDRVLVLKPGWAEPVALDRLLAEPGAFDGRRVRVRGELWRVEPGRAALVPAGSGPERVPIEALTAFIQDPANAGREPPSERPLPARHLHLACEAGGAMKTLSFYDAREDAAGGEVEIAGRLHREGGPGGTPVLQAVVVVDPPQPVFRAPVLMVLGLAAFGPLVGAGLAYIGWRLAR
mgnify:CR=1 FL=1